jgi:hypothetical protein
MHTWHFVIVEDKQGIPCLKKSKLELARRIDCDRWNYSYARDN